MHGPRVAKHNSASRDRGYEPLTADWDVNEEAAGFAKLYRLGRLTVQQATSDILMSDEALRLLIIEYPTCARTLRAIQAARQRTYEAFLALIGGEGGYGRIQ